MRVVSRTGGSEAVGDSYFVGADLVWNNVSGVVTDVPQSQQQVSEFSNPSMAGSAFTQGTSAGKAAINFSTNATLNAATVVTVEAVLQDVETL